MLVGPGMDRIDKCLINALGDDALGADLARRLEQGRAIANHMIDRDKTRVAGAGNNIVQ